MLIQNTPRWTMRLGQRVVGWTVKPTAGKVTAAMDITAYNALVLWITTTPNWHQV